MKRPQDGLDKNPVEGGLETRIEDHLKAAHARLSSTGRRFLEFVERHPECLHRSTFARLEPSVESFAPFPLQSWPLFVDQEVVRDLELAATRLPRLVFDILERVFDNDPSRIHDYYGLDPDFEPLLAELLKRPDLSRRLIARGDYVYGEGGLKCAEINMTSPAGWQSVRWADTYQEIPVITKFLAERETSVSCRDTVDVFLSFMHRETCHLGSGGELNLALRVAPKETIPPSFQPFFPRYEAYLDRRWREILEREGFEGRGRMTFCDDREFESRGTRLLARGRPVHGVIEYTPSPLPEALLTAWMDGRLKLYNGPLKLILGDKRNLALLSEYADTDRFDPDERGVIHRFVPWSRQVRSCVTRYRERETPLKDLLLAEQDRFLLKPGRSSKGHGIHVGRATSSEAWRRKVEEALSQGGYLAQEYVESLPFPGQEGSSGYGPQTVVWGLFAYGEDYGGGFLRLAANSEQEYVVNTERGALEGVFFEVGERTTSPAFSSPVPGAPQPVV